MPYGDYEKDKKQALDDLALATAAGQSASNARYAACQARLAYEQHLVSYQFAKEVVGTWLAANNVTLPPETVDELATLEAAAGEAARTALTAFQSAEPVLAAGAALVASAFEKYHAFDFPGCSADALAAEAQYDSCVPQYQAAAYHYGQADGYVVYARQIYWDFAGANDIVIPPS